MATYTYNGNTIIAPITFSSNEPVFVSESISLKQNRVSQGAQRWELSFQVQNNSSSADLLIGTVDEIDNAATMIMPQLKDVADEANALGVVASNASYSAGTTSIQIRVSSVTSGKIPKGSFVKWSNHSKVYLLKEELDIEAIGAGNTQTVDFYPALKADINSSTFLQWGNSCVITYYRDVSDVAGITYQDGVMYNAGTISLVEAL